MICRSSLRAPYGELGDLLELVHTTAKNVDLCSSVGIKSLCHHGTDSSEIVSPRRVEGCVRPYLFQHRR